MYGKSGTTRLIDTLATPLQGSGGRALVAAGNGSHMGTFTDLNLDRTRDGKLPGSTRPARRPARQTSVP